ncbi:Zn-dependent oxidoreductase [Geomonas silvestris]|uniref:Zinc-type alcohol dehydrogenase-like protein n=1 Tax=Geomonas silvestris TaxID=2740184 RepID=A0A6V8MDT4_9BACT|nr:zinc-binding alcohol dehydrogenase family protein [Geomonas silvestris]GFO58156.1 Zn-dependent oxidoreductase [Geomonas silvestris]
MKAFVYQKAHPLNEFALNQQDLPDPKPGPLDLLVRVKAFSCNPVDYKIRQSRHAEDAPVILGWDAAGVVEAVGSEVRDFSVGDEVYYAGDLNRPGSYAELQTVDHRLAAQKPALLDFADAAALPLTALTAYEALLERGVHYTGATKALIIGGAGGVGSIAIQLLKAETQATVIATATRPETIAWVKKMGADRVIGRDLKEGLPGGGPGLDVIFSTTHTADYLAVLPELLRPFGHLMVIDDPATLDIVPFKWKALSVHWEFMFSKSVFGYHLETQGDILRKVAAMVDTGRVKSTRSKTLTANEDNLRSAHQALEQGSAVGKIVMQW